jgi:hypothetical protein
MQTSDMAPSYRMAEQLPRAGRGQSRWRSGDAERYTVAASGRQPDQAMDRIVQINMPQS